MQRQISPSQVRAARAFLGWSQDRLAGAAGVSKPTVADFERGTRDPMPQNLAAMRRALEEAGIEFRNDSGRVGLLFVDPEGSA